MLKGETNGKQMAHAAAAGTNVAGGSVVLEADGAIGLNAALTTNRRGSAKAGEIFVLNLSTLNGAITIGASVSALGGATGTAGAASDGGVVTVLNDRKSVVEGEECRSRWSPYH